MLCLQVNDACHLSTHHSTLVEVQNTPSPRRTPGMCWKTPYTAAVTTVIVTTFITQLVSH